MKAPTNMPERLLFESITSSFKELHHSDARIDSRLVESLFEARLSENLEDILESHIAFRERFTSNLTERWGTALELLETAIVLVREVGNYAFTDPLPGKKANLDSRFEALNELHSRACQVAFEIFTLLSNGYADGALARWRSLHETSVFANFIMKAGPEFGPRFVDYQFLEHHKRLVEFKKCREESVPEDQIEEIEKIKNILIDKYGDPFDDNGYGYGWAAEKFDNKSASFSRLQEHAGFEHLRPVYILANDQVHSGSMGTQSSVGFLGTEGRFAPQMAGPSNYGLSLPGNLTLLSLYNVSVPVLLMDPSVTRVGIIGFLKSVFDEAAEVFHEVKEEIERDERELTPQTD